jgi:exodeoxyribonuclease VII small subunit
MSVEHTNHTPDTFSLEAAFKRIKEIQSVLQDGQLGFNESLILFEEAEQLIRQSQLYLNQAEVRIQVITGNTDNTN